MRRFSTCCLSVILAFCIVASAQEGAVPQSQNPAQQQAQPAQPSPGTPTPPVPGNTLEDGTPVKLRISQTVSSADAHVGQTVDFEVLEEVKVGDVVVIPKGGIAWATVTEAQSKRRLGRGGKLNMNIDSVRLADSQKAALRAIKDVKGGGHVGAMTGAMVATSIVFFPAAPLFLFMHGKDITIPKGTEITAYINGNVPLDLAKFAPQGVPAPTSNPAAAAADTAAMCEITSTPPGAEIELDGSFVGSTPSSVSVTAGEHTIKLTKSGFQPWERKVKTSAGSVKITAELEPVPTAEKKVPQ